MPARAEPKRLRFGGGRARFTRQTRNLRALRASVVNPYAIALLAKAGP
jgi:hypothetical protein